MNMRWIDPKVNAEVPVIRAKRREKRLPTLPAIPVPGFGLPPIFEKLSVPPPAPGLGGDATVGSCVWPGAGVDAAAFGGVCEGFGFDSLDGNGFGVCSGSVCVDVTPRTDSAVASHGDFDAASCIWSQPVDEFPTEVSGSAAGRSPPSGAGTNFERGWGRSSGSGDCVLAEFGASLGSGFTGCEAGWGRAGQRSGRSVGCSPSKSGRGSGTGAGDGSGCGAGAARTACAYSGAC